MLKEMANILFQKLGGITTQDSRIVRELLKYIIKLENELEVLKGEK